MKKYKLCEAGNIQLASNPPKNKCIHCGTIWEVGSDITPPFCAMQRENKWQDRWQNHLISACDWIEDDVIKNMTVAKILSRWAVVRDEIQSELDTAISEERERIEDMIKNYFSERIIEDLEVDFVRTKDSHTATRIFEARKNRDEIINLITKEQ